MGQKFPYINWYPGDWLKDPKLSMCSPATRGIWMDALCAMYESDCSGSLTGTPDQLARVLRCPTSDLHPAIAELGVTGAADIREHNGLVTLVNRRMKREHEHKKKSAERQRNQRDRKDSLDSTSSCHASVTPDVTALSHECHNEKISSSPTPPKRNNNINLKIISGEKGDARGKNPSGSTTPPEEFQLSDEMQKWAESIGVRDVNHETVSCMDYFRSKGVRRKDWNATWRNWMRNAVKFESTRHASAQNQNLKLDEGKYDHLYE